MTCEKQVQVKDKFCLTIEEAAEYFNIGEKSCEGSLLTTWIPV